MYCVEENHPAIIEKDIWEAVQLETKRRNDYTEQHGIKQLDFVKVQDKPFTGRIICGECGSAFRRKTWNSTDEIKRYRTEEFVGIIGKSQGIEEFDVDLYFRMVERMTVWGMGRWLLISWMG